MRKQEYLSLKKRISKILEEKGCDQLRDINNDGGKFVTAVFVDIRESTILFTKKNQDKAAKILYPFTSEIVKCMKSFKNLKVQGVRGDCVYGIYLTPEPKDVLEVMEICFYINTLIVMLNKMYRSHGLKTIRVGIGISTAADRVIKATVKDYENLESIWIGSAVTKASKFSDLGNKDGNPPIVLSDRTYKFFMNAKDGKTLTKYTDLEFEMKNWAGEEYYACNVYEKSFKALIEGDDYNGRRE